MDGDGAEQIVALFFLQQAVPLLWSDKLTTPSLADGREAAKHAWHSMLQLAMARFVPTLARVSRREFLTTTSCGLALTMALQGCAQSSGHAQSSSVAASAQALPAATAPPDTQASLEIKIGQMLMVGFRGLEASEDLAIVDEIRRYHLGGVVLFDYDVPSNTPVRNVESAGQVHALISGLQAAAAIPLLVAVDQEGGSVARLKEAGGFAPTVSARALGEANDVERTREVVGAMAQALSGLGFNLNFAPVVDLDINPDNPIIGRLNRSFSADPVVAIAQATAYIEAHHEHGVFCTLKHFPGHGSSAADSHYGLVDITNTWSPVEIEPYTALIKAGAADAIMTAHVFHAKLDPQYPATLSKPI